MSDFLILALVSMADATCLAIAVVVCLVLRRWWLGVPVIVTLTAAVAAVQGTLEATPDALARLTAALAVAVLLYALRDAVRRLRHGGPSGETIWAKSELK